ncbi:hypothetical protein GH714_021113 [Hevea brasiliensis]|uniref:Aspartic peptidase DDI1-type domain-containing protein n=1 Tax=Hevea brasiliensis TaxID=3981 RepID=A0A6A6LQH4_HEVBR|nr:hypothetical protein GH714_021113 [Hevea brasiliensis]
MDTRLMELDGRMEELQGDMQGALNAAIDKLASEGESLRLSQMGEYAALRDENRGVKGADPVHRRTGVREATAKARMKAPNPTSQRRGTPGVKEKIEGGDTFPTEGGNHGILAVECPQGPGERDRECGEGATFCPNQGGGQELRALLDTRASQNFLMVEEAKRLGIPYEKEMGWLKAVNSTPNLIHGVARDTKVCIGDWHGTLDFFVVSMDDSQCILGVEFMDRAKAIPMIFANSMCITEGGGKCVVPLLRGKASNTLATMHVEMHEPSLAAKGEKQLRKGGGTPMKDPKECKRGHTPKLQKGRPPREKVGYARDNVVARSPREESPRGKRVRGDISRGRAGESAKSREELVHLATGTREVLQKHTARASPKQPCGTRREAWEEDQTTRAPCGLSGGECHPTKVVS